MDVLNYFTTKEWKFTNDTFKGVMNKLSPEDRENFACDVAQIEWDHYFRTYMRGIRIYLIKDPLDTLPQARVKWQRYVEEAVLASCFFFPYTYTYLLTSLSSLLIFLLQIILDPSSPQVDSCLWSVKNLLVVHISHFSILCVAICVADISRMCVYVSV